MPRPVVLLIALSALCHAGIAQDSMADSTIAKTAYNNAVSLYHKYTDKQARLYNGWLHLGYSHKIEGTAYYPDNLWHRGSLIYDGIYFADVNMMYDVYKDELIVQHFHRLMMTIHGEKVKEFSYDNNKFIRVTRDSARNIPLSTGFYQELYSGKLKLLAKRQVLLEETITDVLEQKFIPKNFYYLYRNNTWHTVKSYRDLMAVLKERSKDIRLHLKKNKVKYRRERERALIMAVQHFDAITQ